MLLFAIARVISDELTTPTLIIDYYSIQFWVFFFLLSVYAVKYIKYSLHLTGGQLFYYLLTTKS